MTLSQIIYVVKYKQLLMMTLTKRQSSFKTTISYKPLEIRENFSLNLYEKYLGHLNGHHVQCTYTNNIESYLTNVTRQLIDTNTLTPTSL